ncbi:MAG TPA: MFS transporter [Actinomycetaceae bacterium]|nr:MFS transporter [Actinomycetaceae bacterium]
MNRTFASLAYPSYRKWFIGAIVANIGTWMQRIAQTWLVLTELSDDSGLAVSLVVAFQFLPVLFLTPIGGLLADRVPRRALIQLTQAGLALASVGLGTLVLTGVIELWHVYVFAVLLGILSSLDSPVRQTFVSELVPRRSLPNAVGLNGASFNTARIFGPALAGFLVAWVGSGWVFMLTGAGFLAPIIAVGMMKDEDMYTEPRLDKEQSDRRSRGFGEALRYVRTHADIALILVVMGFVSAFGLNFQLFISIMIREAYGRGPEDFGIVNTLMGLGALAGALMAARRVRPRTRLVVFAAFFYGALLVAAASAPTYAWFAIALIPAGLMSTTMMNSANSTIQLASEPHVRGRVMSLYLMVFLGSTPIASPLMGWIADTFGARVSVALGGIVTMLAALGAMLWAWRRWGVRVEWVVRPRPAMQVINPVDTAAATATASEPIDLQHVDHATELARRADPKQERRGRSRAPFRFARRRSRSNE